MAMVKRKIYKLLNLLAYDGHFTAISAACVSALPTYLLGFSVPVIIHIIPFLGSEIIYSFNRYKEKKQDGFNLNNETLLRKKNIFYPFFFFFFLFFIGYLLWIQHIELLLFSFIVIAMGLLYTIFLKKLTKKIVGIKVFFVSFCWALIVFLPFVFKRNFLENFFSALIIFLFVFLNVLLFELFLDFRDIKQDRKNNLLTLPAVMTMPMLIFSLCFLNFLSFFMILLGIVLNLLPTLSFFLFFSFLYNLIFLLIITKKVNIKERFYEFLVDFGKILWLLIVFSVFYDGGF